MNDINLDSIPVSSLQSASRNLLSLLLNPTKLFATEDGLPRDWRGLASLVNIPGEIYPAILNSSDQTAYVLSFWSKSNPGAKLKDLQMYLEKLDRFDVIDDTKEIFETEARNRKLNNNDMQLEVSGADYNYKSVNDTDSNYLTVDDANLAQQGSPLLQKYDAFVLYADDDIDFVTELIERMEGYGFKFCLKDRDLLGGLSSQHSAVLRVIAERCARLLIILSPSFVESPEQAFFYQFAQALGIDKRQRKIIPVLYKNCVLPPELSYYFLLDYQRAGNGRLWNFWDKLRDSLRVQPPPLNKKEKLIIQEMCPNAASTHSKEILEQKSQLQLPSLETKWSNIKPSGYSQQYAGGIENGSNISNRTNQIPSPVHVLDNNSSSIPGSSSSNLSLDSMSSGVNRDNRSEPSITRKKKCSKNKQWFKNLIKSSSSSSHCSENLTSAFAKSKKKNKTLKEKICTSASY